MRDVRPDERDPSLSIVNERNSLKNDQITEKRYLYSSNTLTEDD